MVNHLEKVGRTCSVVVAWFIASLIAMAPVVLPAASPSPRLIASTAAAADGVTVSQLPAQSSQEVAELDRASKRREAEAIVRPLIDQHLTEVRPLLETLRANQPDQYERALFELAKSARKIELARERSPELYQIEIESLQAKTQMNLLAARLRVRDAQADRDRLRGAIERSVNAEQRRARHTIDQLREKLDRAKASLIAAEDRAAEKAELAESLIDQNYRTLLKRAGLDPTVSADLSSSSTSKKSDKPLSPRR